MDNTPFSRVANFALSLNDREAHKAAIIASNAWVVPLAARLWPGSPGTWFHALWYDGFVKMPGLDVRWLFMPARPRPEDRALEGSLWIGFGRGIMSGGSGDQHQLFSAPVRDGHVLGTSPATLETAYRAALTALGSREPRRTRRARVVRALLAMLPPAETDG